MSKEGGALVPPSKVTVSVAPSGVTTWKDSQGNLTVLEMLDIEIVWGSKPSDRLNIRLPKEPEVTSILAKLKKKAPSILSAKAYAHKLSELTFLDYRYGACEKMLTGEEKGTRYPCNAAIVIPGLDGYKCSKCGYVFRADFLSLVTTQAGKKRRKEKKVEQVPLDQLPASQLDLFQGEAIVEQPPLEVEVWQRPSDEDHEQAHLELLEQYIDD